MAKISAGLLMYRIVNGEPEFLLAHPGGPFWRNKDAGAWTIPKGEVQEGEELLAAAIREFQEETGCVPGGEFLPLKAIKQKSGKVVHAWAFEGNCDPSSIRSNTCRMEWPPRSGRFITCPEIDRIAFFRLDAARVKANPAQVALLDELSSRIAQRSRG